MAININENEMLKDALLDGKFSHSYLLDHIFLPDDKDDTPQILGWSGPARCGSTGLLFLLASQPEIDHAYFQPQKTILRYGKPNLTLEPSDSLICMKEVFMLWCVENRQDPLASLLEKGVPAEKITWVIMLRDPVQNFGSWYGLLTDAAPDKFAKVQQYTIELFYKHRKNGIKVLPLVYDFFEGGREEEVLNALFAKTNLPLQKVTNRFNKDKIYEKLSPGEWQDQGYFNFFLEKTLSRDRYTYSSSSKELPESLKKEVEQLCRKDYEEFCRLACSELGL